MGNQLPKHLIGLDKKKRVLNLGCGEDMFGNVRMDVAKTKATTITGDIEKKLPFKTEEFDIIYTQFLFEHLTNPHNFLKECLRILKKEGKLILITDNAGFWGFHTGRYTKTLGTIHYGGYRFGEDMHYALYTPEHLRNHFEKAGFNVAFQKYQNYAETRDRAGWKKFVVGIFENFLIILKLPQVAGYGIYIEGVKK